MNVCLFTLSVELTFLQTSVGRWERGEVQGPYCPDFPNHPVTECSSSLCSLLQASGSALLPEVRAT